MSIVCTFSLATSETRPQMCTIIQSTLPPSDVYTGIYGCNVYILIGRQLYYRFLFIHASSATAKRSALIITQSRASIPLLVSSEAGIPSKAGRSGTSAPRLTTGLVANSATGAIASVGGLVYSMQQLQGQRAYQQLLAQAVYACAHKGCHL